MESIAAAPLLMSTWNRETAMGTLPLYLFLSKVSLVVTSFYIQKVPGFRDKNVPILMGSRNLSRSFSKYRRGIACPGTFNTSLTTLQIVSMLYRSWLLGLAFSLYAKLLPDWKLKL